MLYRIRDQYSVLARPAVYRHRNDAYNNWRRRVSAGGYQAEETCTKEYANVKANVKEYAKEYAKEHLRQEDSTDKFWSVNITECHPRIYPQQYSSADIFIATGCPKCRGSGGDTATILDVAAQFYV